VGSAQEQQQQREQEEEGEALGMRCVCGLCVAHFASSQALTLHMQSAEHQNQLALLKSEYRAPSPQSPAPMLPEALPAPHAYLQCPFLASVVLCQYAHSGSWQILKSLRM
jgi:hypothetical protein